MRVASPTMSSKGYGGDSGAEVIPDRRRGCDRETFSGPARRAGQVPVDFRVASVTSSLLMMRPGTDVVALTATLKRSADAGHS